MSSREKQATQVRSLSRVEGGGAPSPKEEPEHTVPGAEGPAFSKEQVL